MVFATLHTRMLEGVPTWSVHARIGDVPWRAWLGFMQGFSLLKCLSS